MTHQEKMLKEAQETIRVIGSFNTKISTDNTPLWMAEYLDDAIHKLMVGSYA